MREDEQLAVVDALSRALDSQTLQGSQRSRDFLAYVVTETLAGRSARLSERTVGRYALDRAAGFDGRRDASVRVQATRVRKALADYYQNEGANETLRIELPLGSYVPRFASQAVPSGHPTEPGVLIRQFDAVGDESAYALATSLGEALAYRLSSFQAIRVFGPTPASAVQGLQVTYVVHGNVRVNADRVSLEVRATDIRTGTVIWAVSDAFDVSSTRIVAVAEHWVAAVAGELGDYSGVLLNQPVPIHPGSDGLDNAARLSYYTYVSQGTNEALLAAGRALATALGAGGRSPVLLAMRASTLVVAVAYGLSENAAADLVEAESLARESLALENRNAHAYLALGTVALVRGRYEVAIAHAREAMRFGPGHPTTVATAGSLCAFAGQWDEGVDLIRQALRLNPAFPGYFRGLLALDRLLAGDDAGALAEASVIHAPDKFWGPLYRGLALDGLGHTEQAREEIEAAIRIEPALQADMPSVLNEYATLTDEQLEVVERRLAPFLE
ncbi:MAG: hypothetical protein V9E82_01290 [Candidatus Nanopelagicales bacterium]